MSEINIPNSDEFKMPQMPNFRGWLGPVIGLILIFAAASTSFYTVAADSQGVVLRFGKYVRTTQPGLHFKLPFGAETVKKVRVTHVFKEEFGFRTVRAGVRTVYAGTQRAGFGRSGSAGSMGFPPGSFLTESMMLTGDLNMAVVEFIVQYRIKDPVQFLFNVRDTSATIRAMTEAAMRSVVGDRMVNEVLTAGREEIRIKAKEELQQLLDRLNTGIQITNVVLQDVNPPDEVRPSFNEVNEARQEKEKTINQARQEYNRVVPKARGEAEQMIREAEGYALERVNEAKGDAKKFLLTWEAYSQAQDVTRRRLFLEMMNEVIPNVSQKYIVDESVKGVLPLLQLSGRSEGGK